MRLVQTLLQVIYPALCRNCSQVIPPSDIFCQHCLALVTPVVSIRLPVTTRQYLTVFAVSDYQHPVKVLITKKFSGDVLASKQLACLITSFTPINTLSIDYIVPVPLHWTRYAQRGFNQSYEIAKVLGRQLNIPVVRFVKRSRKTAFQSTQSAHDRQENVKGAFTLNWWYKLVGTEFLRDKNILLVDDLCTTGATLVQVAKIIAQYKPASLTAVVGCRNI